MMPSPEFDNLQEVTLKNCLLEASNILSEHFKSRGIHQSEYYPKPAEIIPVAIALYQTKIDFELRRGR